MKKDTFGLKECQFGIICKLPNGDVHQLFLSQSEIKEETIYVLDHES